MNDLYYHGLLGGNRKSSVVNVKNGSILFPKVVKQIYSDEVYYDSYYTKYVHVVNDEGRYIYVACKKNSSYMEVYKYDLELKTASKVKEIEIDDYAKENDYKIVKVGSKYIFGGKILDSNFNVIKSYGYYLFKNGESEEKVCYLYSQSTSGKNANATVRFINLNTFEITYKNFTCISDTNSIRDVKNAKLGDYMFFETNDSNSTNYIRALYSVNIFTGKCEWMCALSTKDRATPYFHPNKKTSFITFRRPTDDEDSFIGCFDNSTGVFKRIADRKHNELYTNRNVYETKYENIYKVSNSCFLYYDGKNSTSFVTGFSTQYVNKKYLFSFGGRYMYVYEY